MTPPKPSAAAVHGIPAQTLPQVQPGKESVAETKPVEIFKCPQLSCEFHANGFPTKELLIAHVQEHRKKEDKPPVVTNALEYCLTSMKTGLGLNSDGTLKEKKTDEMEIKTEIKSESTPQARATGTPLPGTTPNRQGLTPNAGKMGSPSAVMKTPQSGHARLPTGSNKSTGGKVEFKDEAAKEGPNDQLPTPPSTIWEGALSPSLIHQCFDGLEQYSGLTASNQLNLTPVYTPGGSSPDADADSVGLGSYEEWGPFGMKMYNGSLLTDYDWDQEDASMEESWNLNYYELIPPV